VSQDDKSTDQLVEEIYQQLSAFRSASAQLAEHAKQTSATSESWKTMTMNFSKTVEDTREGIASLVNASKAAAERASLAHDNVTNMTAQIHKMDLATRLDELAAGQKEVREMVIDLHTRQQDRIRSLEAGLDNVRTIVRQSFRIFIVLQALILLVIAIALVKIL
jgi:hypothetical protein